MLKPLLSSPIIWTDDLDNRADKHYAATVTAVYDEMLDVIVFPPGYTAPMPRMGVRHKDDPNREAIRNVGEGCWLTQEEHVRILEEDEALARALEELKRKR